MTFALVFDEVNYCNFQSFRALIFRFKFLNIPF